MSGDNFTQSGPIPVLGSVDLPVELESAYSVLKSGLLPIKGSQKILLQVNYTMGSGETSNSIELKYEIANSAKPSIKANTIAFADSDPDTITDSGNGFLTSGFASGQEIIVTGSASNDGIYTIESVTAGTITLISTDELTAESAASANVTIQALSGAFYRLQNEAISTGTVTRTQREDTFVAVSAAGTYDKFIVELDDLGAGAYSRIYAKETGVETNEGSVWIEALTIGR